MTVSLVRAGIPGCGVNTAASPSRCHAPATAGDSRGSGADAGSAGLAGLADRVSGVDGTLSVESPSGGPTVISAVLPCG